MDVYSQLVQCMHINQGDIILLSSDALSISIAFRKIGYRTVDLNLLLDKIIEALGTQGTLLLPTYNWGFCRGNVFNYCTTKGEVGSLGNIALKRTDFKRTKHPIYSFAVYGHDKEYLCALDNKSSFGDDSPFAYLDKNKARNIVLGVQLADCFTFAHYVEQQSGFVTYRYEKNFIAPYCDSQGVETTRTYSMFVRDLDLDVENDLSELERVLFERGIVSYYNWNGLHISRVQLTEAAHIILDDIRNNRSRKICKYKGQ